MSEKTCKTCGLTKPLSDFPRNGSGGSPYRADCKPCHSAKKQAAKPPKTSRRVRKPELHPQLGVLLKECSRCGRSKPLDQFPTKKGSVDSRCLACKSALSRERFAASPERIRALDKASRLRNCDRRRTRSRLYRHSHMDKFRDSGQRARARRLKCPKIEHIDRQAVIERDKSTCYLCGRLLAPSEITLDHVVPLERGGAHTPENVRVACRPCNSRKRDKKLEELDWYKTGNAVA